MAARQGGLIGFRRQRLPVSFRKFDNIELEARGRQCFRCSGSITTARRSSHRGCGSNDPLFLTFRVGKEYFAFGEPLGAKMGSVAPPFETPARSRIVFYLSSRVFDGRLFAAS